MKKKRNNFDREIEEKRFRVTIFGSARISKNDKEYKDVYNLAKMIGEREMELVTGGGPGLMMAASAGHKAGKKNGAHTIGLGVKLYHEQEINKYVDLWMKYDRFSRRLDNFMSLSNVIVVAHGGVGTLLELFYAWQLMQVNHICNIPIILIGKQWSGLLKWLEKEPLKRKFLEKKDLYLLFHAKDYKEEIKMIDKAHEQYNNGDKNYCLNYKKYKLY